MRFRARHSLNRTGQARSSVGVFDRDADGWITGLSAEQASHFRAIPSWTVVEDEGFDKPAPPGADEPPKKPDRAEARAEPAKKKGKGKGKKG